MKQLILFTACVVLIWIVSITSCKKEKVVPANRTPIARAGTDFSIALSSCSERTSLIVLDGSGSADPDANIVFYSWTNIYGPQGYILRNSVSAKASVENLSSGEYAFELYVRDTEGLVSRDTMLIRIMGPAKEYDLDITFNSTFNFTNNFEDCYYYYICSYYDYTVIEGKGIFLPFGEFNIGVWEYADTAALSIIHNTNIQIYVGAGNNESLSGNCSVNFKKLIEQGGGSINGSFTVDSGSAQACDPNVFNNLPPLIVTGSLNVAARTISLRIKGKVYF